MVGGYVGKILRINLSGRKVMEEKFDLTLARLLIGGLGTELTRGVTDGWRICR